MSKIKPMLPALTEFMLSARLIREYTLEEAVAELRAAETMIRAVRRVCVDPHIRERNAWLKLNRALACLDKITGRKP